MNKTDFPCDLHLHSYFSDGNLSPGELVGRSLGAGLAAISITDHDTIEGQSEAILAGEASGLEVVTGVEFSVKVGTSDVHILGYLFDHRDETLTGRLGKLSASRLSRAAGMVDRLTDLGVELDLHEVLSLTGGGTVGRLHIARLLMEKGYISDIQEAFRSYIGEGGPAFLEKEALSLEEVVSILNDAGGIAVWAHPGANIKDSKLLDRVVSSGVEGLEAWHPNHNAEITNLVLSRAKRRGLICTGGSDYHFTEAMKVDIGGKSAPYACLMAAREIAARHLA